MMRKLLQINVTCTLHNGNELDIQPTAGPEVLAAIGSPPDKVYVAGYGCQRLSCARLRDVQVSHGCGYCDRLIT